MARGIRIVDVFTERPLAGNQLAVVLDGDGLSASTMQRIAREMNFSETTFVLPAADPNHAARVRIFSPTSELPFAGHPTIGTAWVLHDEGLARGLQFVLEEKVGPVPVRAEIAQGRVDFWMTHPQVTFGEVFPHATIAAAIGVDPSDVLSDVPAQVASTGFPFVFVPLRDRRAVDAAAFDGPGLRKLVEGHDLEAVYMFAANGANRLYSRMFGVGLGEDPATGSAAGPLGAFAVKYRLVERAPTVSITNEQGTKMGRQSFIQIALAYGDSPDVPTRIEVGGSVVPVLSGTLSDFGQ